MSDSATRRLKTLSAHLASRKLPMDREYPPVGQGEVAAGHSLTAQAARDILAAGGNGVDACVAAFFTSCVAEPLLTSVAGGGFLMIHDPVTKKNVAFDGMPRMPAYRLDEPPKKIIVDFGETEQPFWIGRGAVAPPGALPTMLAAHKKYGRIHLGEVLAPAIRVARSGVVVTPYTEQTFRFLRAIVASTPEARKLYHSKPAGKDEEVDEFGFFKSGEIFKNEAFANFLERLVDNPDPDILKQSYLDAGLPYESFTPREMEPLTRTFANGHTLVTIPPPYPGGLLITHAVQHFQRSAPKTSTERMVAMIAALRATDKIRREKVDGHLGDVNIVENTLGSTTHVSIIDHDGMAVSMTTSNGEGSGIVLPDVGVQTNNFLGEEDLHPHGFFKHAPGSPMPSMMSPSFVLRGSDVVAVIGSGGSERIRSVVAKAACDIMDGMAVQDFVLAPRAHWDGKAIQVEPVDDETKAAIKASNTDVDVVFWKETTMYFGGLHAATIHGSCGDPRRAGAT